MKIEFFLNFDFLGLFIAMVIYPVFCFIEFIYLMVRGLKKWAEKQEVEKKD